MHLTQSFSFGIIATDNKTGTSKLVAKVSDFGLSKTFYDNIRYKKQKRHYVPWKWMALEYMNSGYFTLTSDVWSFAVVVWEILSFGRMPYGSDDFDEVLYQLENGCHLPCPADINDISTWSPKGLYNEISKMCFVPDPMERASFSQVVELIEKELSQEEMIHYTQMSDRYLSTSANQYLQQNQPHEC